ncbi:hypothetical protein PAXRUDRAFT_562831 [Paxillus rubicundulus Ve08.2h10]|uniref:Uncharacterized protein n=1 Tax=Paxillus rubicundulus Ve08.2h10 TaxID=930991 RepID=A0A0D0DUE1_9AGAM|nr:hypothetical protein PAXRUDRAFT_562831 [Paxillus rubicundulus Ve08.2h10]
MAKHSTHLIINPSTIRKETSVQIPIQSKSKSQKLVGSVSCFCRNGTSMYCVSRCFQINIIPPTTVASSDLVKFPFPRAATGASTALHFIFASDTTHRSLNETHEESPANYPPQTLNPRLKQVTHLSASQAEAQLPAVPITGST